MCIMCEVLKNLIYYYCSMSIVVLGIEKYFCFDIFKSYKIKKIINIVIVCYFVLFFVNFNKDFWRELMLKYERCVVSFMYLCDWYMVEFVKIVLNLL